MFRFVHSIVSTGHNVMNETTLYILMIEDYPPRDEEGGSPPPKEKPPVKIEMMHPHQIILSEEVSVDKNDDSRLEEFRQLKRDIRGSTQHLVVGMDIAKERHHAFFGTPAGKVHAKTVGRS